jgi:hypothetical protein
VPEPAVNLVRAELHEMDSAFKKDAPNGKRVKVQFNPETLKVTFANQLVQPSGPGDQRGTSSIQYVGAGTTKLSLQLWFDITALPSDTKTKDVRELTKEVAFFITPKEVKGGKSGPQFVPPPTRFLWGSFQFDGIVESLEETLDFFSPEGRPLRAGVSLGMTQQSITEIKVLDAGGFPAAPTAAGTSGGPGAGRQPGRQAPRTPGTRPLTPAPQGGTVQAMAEAEGRGGDWQSIAAANGIENPRRLVPGQLVDVNVSAPRI